MVGCGGGGVGAQQLQYQSTRFPWLLYIHETITDEPGNVAFYCLRWQVSAASRVQPVDTATSLIMVETRWLGAASLAMKAARLAQMQLGSVRSVRELSVATRCGYVVVLLDAAESVAPSLHGVRAVVRVVQQMTRLAQPAPQLMLLTGGVQASSPSAGALNASSAAHGGAWGLGRVVRLEQPSWRVVSADLLADCWLPDAVGELIGEGGASSGAPTELVWRGGERQSAMLSWNASVGQPSRRCVRGGSYVITGGLGGLGLRAAVLVAQSGASSVFLSSRSGVCTQPAVGLLASIGPGACVRSLACDSATASEVLMLGHAAAGRCSVVLHAAGVLLLAWHFGKRKDTILAQMVR